MCVWWGSDNVLKFKLSVWFVFGGWGGGEREVGKWGGRLFVYWRNNAHCPSIFLSCLGALFWCITVGSGGFWCDPWAIIVCAGWVNIIYTCVIHRELILYSWKLNKGNCGVWPQLIELGRILTDSSEIFRFITNVIMVLPYLEYCVLLFIFLVGIIVTISSLFYCS